MISWAAAPLGSPSSTDCPSAALSAQATRCDIAAGNTGNGSCAKAVHTSRPIAVLVIVRFITKAAVRLSLHVVASVLRSTTACALHTSCGDGWTGIRIRSAASRMERAVDIQPARIVVHCDKRCHNPILREAALDQPSQAMPWLRSLLVVFQDPCASLADPTMVIDVAPRTSALIRLTAREHAVPTFPAQGQRDCA
jgi:hypothetical protein